MNDASRDSVMRITRTDIEHFARWSHDVNPLHVDADFGRQTAFGDSISHGVLSLIELFA